MKKMILLMVVAAMLIGAMAGCHHEVEDGHASAIVLEQ